MVGLSETYFAAFYIAVGMSEFSVGLLATVPYLLGSALQMLAPWGVQQVRSYKCWTTLTIVLQGLSLLAMALVAYCQQVNFATLLAVATVYWASGLATGPAWNTWIEFMVPKKIRARYFSLRMRVCQLCLIGAIAISGLLLRSFSSEDQRLLIFVGLFAVAGVLRLISVAALRSQSELKCWLSTNVSVAQNVGEGADMGQLIKSTLPFFAAMQFAVYISGPFFAPFMLTTLGLGYTGFMTLVLLGYLGRVLALPVAGRIAKVAGPGRLMLWGAIGIVPMSAVWMYHQSFVWLCAIQLASGAAWACYELSMSLVFIERIPSHQRMRVLSWFNTFNGVAMVAGSLLGGLLLASLGNSVSGFMTLFALSGIARMVAFFWFPFQFVESKLPTGAIFNVPWTVTAPLLNGRAMLRPFFVPTATADASEVQQRLPLMESKPQPKSLLQQDVLSECPPLASKQLASSAR